MFVWHFLGRGTLNRAVLQHVDRGISRWVTHAGPDAAVAASALSAASRVPRLHLHRCLYTGENEPNQQKAEFHPCPPSFAAPNSSSGSACLVDTERSMLAVVVVTSPEGHCVPVLASEMPLWKGAPILWELPASQPPTTSLILSGSVGLCCFFGEGLLSA